jgi:histidinol-phosphate aminotransferase
MNDILRLARPEIRALVPAATHSHDDSTRIRLHANENPWPDEDDDAPVALNRYCDGQPRALVQAFAAHYGSAADGILVTRGSDEAIDLLVRAFCRAGTDRILVCPPCFGMYRFSAEVQGAGVVTVPLAADFALDAEALIRGWSPAVKVVFLCSPNNPTGNALDATPSSACWLRSTGVRSSRSTRRMSSSRKAAASSAPWRATPAS